MFENTQYEFGCYFEHNKQHTNINCMTVEFQLKHHNTHFYYLEWGD
jgi:hypothetical protein